MIHNLLCWGALVDLTKLTSVLLLVTDQGQWWNVGNSGNTPGLNRTILNILVSLPSSESQFMRQLTNL